jgi:hypothetical protein
VLVLSEAVLVIVIEVRQVDYDYEHAHEHDGGFQVLLARLLAVRVEGPLERKSCARPSRRSCPITHTARDP